MGQHYAIEDSRGETKEVSNALSKGSVLAGSLLLQIDYQVNLRTRSPEPKPKLSLTLSEVSCGPSAFVTLYNIDSN